MVAIPVKTDREYSAITPLFGKAKWFALIDGGKVAFWKNENGSGREVVEHFKAAGVTDVIFQEMGGSPFAMLQEAGIRCHHGGEGRTLFMNAYEAWKRGELEPVAAQNMAAFIEAPKGQGTHGRHGAHAHGHRHGAGHRG